MTHGTVAAGRIGAPAKGNRAAAVTVITAVGTAGSFLVGTGMWWVWTHRLVLDWWAVPADAVAYLLLALWCVRVVDRGRCTTDRRAYRAVGIGLATAAVSSLLYLGFLAAVVGGVEGAAGALVYVWPQVLVIKMFNGLLVWPIVFAGLVLWRLCRMQGHVHGAQPVGHTVEGPADLPHPVVRVRADPSKEC